MLGIKLGIKLLLTAPTRNRILLEIPLSIRVLLRPLFFKRILEGDEADNNVEKSIIWRSYLLGY